MDWDSSARIAARYREAVEAGVRLAKDAFGQLDLEVCPQRVRVIELLETVVDTTPDAVRCCAAAALWKALGLAESSISMAFDDGEWKISFSRP